jgi:hypothetical protein
MPTLDDSLNLTIEDDGSFTLVVSDQGVAIPATHAPFHAAGGSDPITIANTQVTGLGTMSTQPANNITVTGGTIAGVTISTSTLSSPTINTPTIAGGTINSAVIGGTTPAAGTFTAVAGTTGTFSGAVSGTTGTFSGNTSVAGTLTVTGAVTLNNDLTVANGGTGASSLTGMVKGNGTSAFTTVTSSTVGQVLRCTGTDAFAFGAVNLADTDAVTGTLPAANGGTGATTLTGVVKGTGTGVLTASPVGLASADVTGTLPVANGGTGATALSTGVVKSNGTVLSSSAVGLASADVTGTLPVTKGGTGAITLTGVIKGTGTGALTASPVGLASADVTGVLPIANGGTGFNTNPYGQLGSQIPGDVVTYNTGFVKLDMITTFDSSNSSGFDDGSGVSNKLRYTGSATRRFLIFASADILDVNAGSNYSIMLFKNDIAIPQTECRANAVGKGSSFLAKLVTNWIVSLAQKDFVDLRVDSITDDNGAPQRMRLVATPI